MEFTASLSLHGAGKIKEGLWLQPRLAGSSPHPCCAQRLSHVQLFATPWIAAHRASLSLEFSWQEYWSELAFPPPGELRDPGIEPACPASPAGQVDSLPPEPAGKPLPILTL